MSAKPQATGTAKGEEKARKLWQLVEEIRIAMLTTQDDGVLRSRPMECVQVDEDRALWFFTGASSPKTSEVRDDRHVNLSLVDKANQNYVSISGRATIVHDREKAKELWTEDQRAWFPDGVDDRNLALLKVKVEQAEYWDKPTSAMVAAHGLVRAVAGETPDLGENEKLSFEHSH
jgi:general stress protein 26